MKYLELWFISILFVMTAFYHVNSSEGFDIPYEWRIINFTFPCQQVADKFKCNGSYIPANVVPWDVTYWYKGCRGNVTEKYFVTTPLFFPGTPATLSTVNWRTGLFDPYPDWSYHRGDQCGGIYSAQVTQIDCCNRLWILDSGTKNIYYHPNRTCRPQLWVVDLTTDKLVMRYEIPRKDLTPSSILFNMVLDCNCESCCNDMYVYIADSYGNCLIVIDAYKNESWRVSSNYFYPDPDYGRIDYNGSEINMMRGVHPLALSPEAENKTLYTTSLASKHLFCVENSVLKNNAYFPNDYKRSPEIQQSLGYTKPSQTHSMTMDKKSVLYFNSVSSSTLSCWNSNLPFNGDNIVNLISNSSLLQYISSMKTYKCKNGEEKLLLLSNGFFSYMLGEHNTTNINFRIIKLDIAHLVNGTACDTQPRCQYYYPSWPTGKLGKVLCNNMPCAA